MSSKTTTLFFPLIALIALTLCGCCPVMTGRPAEIRCESCKNATIFCVAELDGRLYPYRLFLPSSYQHAPEVKGEKPPLFPLVIVCHPGGGDENQYFQWKGQKDRIQTIAEERGYVIACPAGPNRNWHSGDGKTEKFDCKDESVDEVMEVIREIVKQRWIDKDRIYMMGASSGGMATYGTASAHPEQFAAVAAVVAAPTDEMLDGLSKLPVMMFNANRDKHFPMDEVYEKAGKIEAAGGEVKVHEVDGGHGGYRNLESYAVIFDWFDAHRRATQDDE